MTAKNSLNRAALKGGAATFVLAMLATPAVGYAQTPAPTKVAAAAAAADDEGTIVVTGSLIKNPNLVSSSPITVTTADTIALRGSNVAEEVLRDIPGIVPSIGSAVNNGNGGSSFVNLRGIGANRNLVLLDGQRLAPSGLGGLVDLNNIPLALVERVDALTGSAVTTYGADAIAGVVNFVTKKDFSGVSATISNGLSERGDGQTFRADITIGANFDSGRGNAVLSIGYQKADAVYQGARSISEKNVDSFSGAPSGGSGTTTPARFTNTRVIDPATGLPSTNPATVNGGFRQVSQDGNSFIPFYQFFNFNPYNIFQTPFERFNIFAKANYQISDAVEVYTRALYSKNSVRTIIAPSGLFTLNVDVPLSNPYMSATQRNQFCALNTTQGTGVYTPLFTPAQCTAASTALSPSDPNYRTINTSVGRRTVEFGPRSSEYSTSIFDYQAGLRGPLTSSIDWDLSASYGESDKRETATGYVINSRAKDALLATNKLTCLSGNAGCVPLNIFGGQGSITPDQAGFVSASAFTFTKTALAQVKGLVSGDFGVASPGATDAIGFAIGAEYRKYSGSVLPDAFTEAGELGGGGGPTARTSGGFNVKEVYGELIAPLVQDKPFFQNLTLEGGARYSSYKVSVPGNKGFDAFTWKVGGSWEIEQGFKLRGNYSRAVRAPNIGELFTPVTTGLTSIGSDPCAGTTVPGLVSSVLPLNLRLNDTNLRNICVAQGAKVGQLGSIENPTAGQGNSYGGGNPNLKPEKATTWTIGAVFQPTFAPGLAITVDYYNIKVTNAITTPTSGDALGDCFNSVSAASVTNPACLAIRRNPNTGSFDADAQGLPLPLSNLGTIKTRGIDATIGYSHDIGFAKLGITGNFNYTFENKFMATPTSAVNRECVGYFSPNCGSIQPKWQTSLRTGLSWDSFDASLFWRHIDSVIQEPLNAQVAAPGDNNAFFPAFRKIKSYDYFDLTGRVSVTKNITLLMTVTNLFDRQPPLVGAGAGSTAYNSGNTFPSTYDALGRRYTMQVGLKF